MNLYNKYKPTKLKDIEGQEFVRSVIRGLVKDLPNGIIVTGAHGVGKTLLLTLLAKLINCDTPIEGEPCYQCTSCNSSQEDILEIDAATHSGVEAMRQLLESVNYMPLHLKYKVYIIDEAHMLSASAFDALLLTLHELPEYVKIFFATTKLHKIPATISSRCLVLQMSRISHMKAYINRILAKEGVQLKDSVIELIVKAADGSIRQALSTMQLCLMAPEADLEGYLKLIDPKKARDIFVHILNGEVEEALELWNKCYILGYDEKFMMNELLGLICECTKAKLGINSKEKELVEVYELPVELLCNYWEIVLTQLEGLNHTSSFIVESTIMMLCTVLDRFSLNTYIKEMQ